MEYSKKLHLALPSRDNDVDLADINQIADNFRIIDENVVVESELTEKLNGKLSDSAGSVKSNNLAEGCVSWDKIGDGQVTATKIAENAVYARHIVDGNVTKEKLSTDLQTAIDTIGAVKVDRLDVDTAEEGLYVTKEIDSEAGGYIESGAFLVFVSAQTASDKRIVINSSKNGFLFFSNGTTRSAFSSTITEGGQNAPTTAAVYNAIQEALYVNTDEVIE